MDFLSHTGFSTVCENVFSRIIPYLEAKDLHIDVGAYNLILEKDKVVEYNKRITVYNLKAFDNNAQNDKMNLNGFLKLLTMKEYDLVWIMNDIDVIYPAIDVLNHIKDKKAQIGHKSFKSILYFPIDSPMPSKWFNKLEFFDEVVTYTEYAKDIVNTNLLELGLKKHINVIAHGIDRANFFPLKDKSKLREKYNLPIDTIIFGNVNKNQPRKDIGTTLIAFAKFKRKVPADIFNSVLYLHCHPQDPTGINIHRAAQKLGLEFNKDYFLPIPSKYLDKAYSKSELNEIYNCFDCFVSTSMAEGFGLTVVEAMAVGLPIMCGMHTSLKEITNDGEDIYYPIKNLIEHFQINDAENIRFKLNPETLASEMLSFYLDSEIDHIQSKYNYKNQFKKYDWDKIAKQWENLLSKNL